MVEPVRMGTMVVLEWGEFSGYCLDYIDYIGAEGGVASLAFGAIGWLVDDMFGDLLDLFYHLGAVPA